MRPAVKAKITGAALYHKKVWCPRSKSFRDSSHRKEKCLVQHIHPTNASTCAVMSVYVRARERACVGRKGKFIIVGLRTVHLSFHKVRGVTPFPNSGTTWSACVTAKIWESLQPTFCLNERCWNRRGKKKCWATTSSESLNSTIFLLSSLTARNVTWTSVQLPSLRTVFTLILTKQEQANQCWDNIYCSIFSTGAPTAWSVRARRSGVRNLLRVGDILLYKTV
jgi:hypothetical protein